MAASEGTGGAPASAGAGTRAGGRHVTVIGAGIVGACAALYLQREGFAVTLIDRGGPGEGASLGNAGSFGRASIPPTSMPGLLKKLPRMMTNPLEPLAIRWGYLPWVLPWFLRFAANSRKAVVERIADGRAQLLARIFDAYEPLLQATGAHDMVRADGKLHVYETEDGPARSRYALDMRRKRGVKVEVLTGDEAREMEPALGPAVKCAAFFPEVRNVVNPLRLVRRFVEHAVRNGATLLREDVRGFEMSDQGPTAIVTDRGRHAVERVVIACGAWADRLTRQLGHSFPLECERGYHVMIKDPGVVIRSGFTSAERYVVFTQMEEGLRISGIAQFSGLDSPPDWALADRLLANAKAMVPTLNAAVASRWAGPRPSLPDSLPVIGRASNFRNVFFAFGHDHIGMATGAITGQLIAELIAGKPTAIDLGPYRPDRF